jgi:hypothetical protein
VGIEAWIDKRMIFIFILIIALLVLLPSAMYARTGWGVIIGGVVGGAIMAAGCLLLKFFTGIDKATAGPGEIEKLFDLAVIVVPIVLFCYFMFAFLRLNERKRGGADQ